MRKRLNYVGIATAIIIILFSVLYLKGDIGISKSSIEKDARRSQKIDSRWDLAKSTTDTMSAMLFYEDSLDDHIFSIYVKRNGLSFGYFFRGGGSISVVDDSIAEYKIEGYNEKAYLSMNQLQADRIEIDNGNHIETIDIDHTKPFAIVLSSGIGAIKFYDIDGALLETIPVAW